MIPAGLEDEGFVLDRSVLQLRWAPGDPYERLVVRVLALPFGRILDFAPRVDALQRLNPTQLTPDQLGMVMEPFRLIGEHLVGWNLRERVEGVVRDVPATYEGLLSLEVGLIRSILSAWVQASGSVPVPLEQPSSGGATSSTEEDRELAASLGMTTLASQ